MPPFTLLGETSSIGLSRQLMVLNLDVFHVRRRFQNHTMLQTSNSMGWNSAHCLVVCTWYCRAGKSDSCTCATTTFDSPSLTPVSKTPTATPYSYFKKTLPARGLYLPPAPGPRARPRARPMRFPPLRRLTSTPRSTYHTSCVGLTLVTHAV